MVASRRAASAGASRETAAVARALRFAASTLAFGLGGVATALGLASLHMARKVVAPASRLPDTRIVDLDTSAQTVTLSRTPDTVLPGRYGLITKGTENYLKLGSVLAENQSTVKRKLLTQVGSSSRLAAEAAFSGWYYSSPGELHLPYSPELIGSALGPCPAWYFPAENPISPDTWVIQVHGRGTTRIECLRAVPVFEAMGISSLVVSYRNDGEAPRSRAGTYMLGATEWRDIDAAIGFARRRGARRVIVMGWSMGGAIALQAALNSVHRDLIAGVILESPVIDWRIVLRHQTRLLRVPGAISDLAIGALGAQWAVPVTRAGGGIPFDRLDVIARAAELEHPLLILHSDDDGLVPSDASHDLAAARPDLVELQSFDVARHAKLWNYDQDRWSTNIRSWIERVLSTKGGS